MADRLRLPSLSTMYVFKPMSGHNLMQAIARVNRVFPGKEGGLIVDYVGFIALTRELTDALHRNKTIDWNKKESARASMRVMVKRLLKKYKYPPEGQEKALETVMRQCDHWADMEDYKKKPLTVSLRSYNMDDSHGLLQAAEDEF